LSNKFILLSWANENQAQLFKRKDKSIIFKNKIFSYILAYL